MSTKSLFQKEIKRITQRIKKHYKPEKIILFGSCAYGKINPSSDIDLMIIKKAEKSALTEFKKFFF